jgi:hypothetical protein
MRKLLIIAGITLAPVIANADPWSMAHSKRGFDESKFSQLVNSYQNICYPNGPIKSDHGVQVQCKQMMAEIAAAKDQIATDNAEIDRVQSEAAEQAKEQAKIDAKPINVVFRGYQMYINVTLCNQVREGYLVQYVNDVELERANKAIKAIVEQQKKRDPNLDADYAWNEAKQEHNRSKPPITLDYCQNVYLQSLLRASPQPVFNVEKPE